MISSLRPRIFLAGDEHAAERYVGKALSEMYILEQQMIAGRNRAQGYRFRQPFPGVFIKCSKVNDVRVIMIYVAPTSGPGEEEETFEYIKVFVHVDMFTFNTWHVNWWSDTHYPLWNSGDVLTREMVVSAIGCGVICLTTGKLAWSGVVDSLVLAEQIGATPWAGIYGASGYSTVDAIVGYYNNLFPDSLFYSTEFPSIDAANEWFEVGQNPNLTDFWNNFYTDYPNDENIESTSTYYFTWGSYSPMAGWCSDNWNSWEHYMPIWGEQIYDFSTDLFKATLNIIPPEGVEPYRCCQWVEFFTRGATVEIEPMKYREIVKSPTVGFLWYSATYDQPEDRTETAHQCPDEYGYWFDRPIYHREYWQLEEMLGWCNDSTNPDYPYTYRRQLPYVGRLNTHSNSWNADPYYRVRVDEGKHMNYRLSDGFCYYFGMYGGVLSQVTSTLSPQCSPVYTGFYDVDDTHVLSTVIKFGLAAGKRITPWRDRTASPFNEALKQVAEQAVLHLGGSVYSNSAIPLNIEQDKGALIYQRHGIEFQNFNASPGLLYCSPLFNLRVYGIPLKGKRYKQKVQ